MLLVADFLFQNSPNRATTCSSGTRNGGPEREAESVSTDTPLPLYNAVLQTSPWYSSGLYSSVSRRYLQSLAIRETMRAAYL